MRADAPGETGSLTSDPDYRGKGLQLQVTVEDDGVSQRPGLPP
jgi:hypothetical protein